MALHGEETDVAQLEAALRRARLLLKEVLHHEAVIVCECGSPHCLTTRIRAELVAGGL